MADVENNEEENMMMIRITVLSKGDSIDYVVSPAV